MLVNRPTLLHGFEGSMIHKHTGRASLLRDSSVLPLLTGDLVAEELLNPIPQLPFL